MNIRFFEELFIFNIGNNYSVTELQIVMLMKHYIYTAKRLNLPLSLVTLQKKLKYFLILEEHTAIKNNQEEKFEQGWTKYKELLQTIH